MDYYNPAGMAHKLIFTGLRRPSPSHARCSGAAGSTRRSTSGSCRRLSRSGRSTSSRRTSSPRASSSARCVFFYYRLVVKPKRMALSRRGPAHHRDHLHDDGRRHGLRRRVARPRVAEGRRSATRRRAWPRPGQCAAIATIVAPLGGEHFDGHVVALARAGGLALRARSSTRCRRGRSSSSRTRASGRTSTLVLLFLNLLPHSKHFHVITAIPNVFARSLRPAGRLEPMAENAEKLMETFGAAAEAPDPLALPARRRAHRALHVEVDPRLLHVHRVRALLGQLPGAPHGQDPQPQAPDARSARPPLRARGRDRPPARRTRTADRRRRSRR